MNNTLKDRLIPVAGRATLMCGLAFALASCGSEPIPEIPCQSAATLEIICGFHQPEDIEPVPGGHYLLISEMSPFGEEPHPGTLSLYDTQTQYRQALPIRRATDADWGDSACEAPENLDFSPHGIHLSTLADGTLQLLVVSHHPREAVEMLELKPTRDGMELVWRGCLIPPGAPYMNDVTAMADGTVLTTHMFDRGTPLWQLYPMLLLSVNTGHVYRWSPDAGYSTLANSEGSFPNGIISGKSPDVVYVNYYFNNETRAINLRTGEVTAVYKVRKPDNITYADGSLYIASHEVGDLDGMACDGRKTTCPLPFSIHRLDAETMDGGRIFSASGAPFGMATVGVPAYGWLWMGSYVGDRIARVPLSELPPAQ